MAKLLTAPSRFTHTEWVVSNKTKYRNAEEERRNAERLADESSRLISQTDERTRKTQADVNKKLEQRIWDIEHWKKELEVQLDDTVTEINNIEAFIVRLKNAITAVEEPMNIAIDCLSRRETRTDIDLVHDDVQKNLIKEVEVYRGVMELLQRTLEQAIEQLRLNRKAKYNLEKDLKDKFTAFITDDHCRSLEQHSSKLQPIPGSAKIDTKSVTPGEWQNFTHENIRFAERERQNSRQLRSLIDGILQQVSNDQRTQVEETNVAFDRRILETRDVKNKLEAHLDKVNEQIRKMDENGAALSIAIGEKVKPLNLAETRLNERSVRPKIELCRDAPQYRLISEVQELNLSLAELQARLNDNKKSKQALLRNQLEIETDIAIKTNTLKIDDVECMSVRKKIHIQAY